MLLALTAGTEQGGPQSLVVKIQQVNDACYVTLDGLNVTFDALKERAKRERHRPAVIVYDKDAPYKCIGAAIITLQEAGVMRIDVKPPLPK